MVDNLKAILATLMGLNFAGIKFRGSSNPRNLDISQGFNFADEDGSQIIFWGRKE